MVKKFASDLKTEFSGYNGAKLLKDAMAGLTVCAVALPLALAFGVSSGASAAAGMVTAILAGIIIGLLSGASFQISGPTGAMSAVLIAIVVEYGIQGMFVASLISGIILLIAGIFKLGRLISFIPSPVVMGFTSGIAVVIALGQIDNFFGTTSEGVTAVEKLFSYTKLGFRPDWQSVLIGLLVIAIMIVWPKKWNAKVPSSLVSIIVATIVSVVFKMDGLVLVGEIPQTLFLSERLSFKDIDFSMIKGVLSPIITIAALGMIESLMCGASASRMKNESFDADRELVAQGIGNIVIPFFGGVPATAAIARSSVAIKSGQQTRLTGVFHSLFLLAAMFLLGPVMAKLPLCALAGVLMMTAWRMNEWDEIKYVFKHKFKAAISQFLVTLVATVVFDLMVAIIIGVVYSAILFVVASSKITVNFSGFDRDKYRGDCTGDFEETAIAYVTGPVFFGAVDKFNEQFESMPACETLIISMKGVTTIDVSGVKAVMELCENLHQLGINIKFCGLKENVRKYFERAGIIEMVGTDNFYWSVDRALEAVIEAKDGADVE
ncbi:MAG: SulP family inorganic anion transporter [Ruminococcaceae bacterium]|nr:SulP family inorganic anion transporter [Oscillospiraceae bacterium]